MTLKTHNSSNRRQLHDLIRLEIVSELKMSRLFQFLISSKNPEGSDFMEGYYDEQKAWEATIHLGKGAKKNRKKTNKC